MERVTEEPNCHLYRNHMRIEICRLFRVAFPRRKFLENLPCSPHPQYDYLHRIDNDFSHRNTPAGIELDEPAPSSGSGPGPADIATAPVLTGKACDPD